MAFLLVLERLAPVERAVFLLRDVFGYDYAEVAAVVGKTEANCRQLAARARRHLEAERPRFDASRQAKQELAERFFAAVGGGDLDGLVEMLASDAVVYGDGGGKAPQWRVPIVGAERVARLLARAGRSMGQLGVTVRPREINGQPGALVLDPDGRLVNVFVLDIAGGVVQTVRSVINPDKLGHIGPVADVRALLQRQRSDGRAPT
jgi:RNA polymerase sigma-70 factor (ECF subfamily)